MYRKMILGILLAVSLSASYYVVFSGGGTVITGAISSDVTPSYNTPTVDQLAGVYSCTPKTGCVSTSTLALKDDSSVEFFTFLGDKSSSENTDTQNEIAATGEQQPLLPITSDTETTTDVASSAPSGDTASDSQSNTPVEEDTKSVSGIDHSTDIDLNALASMSSQIEKGTWELGSNNILIITLTDNATTTYDVPHKLVVQKVSTSTIQKILYNKDFFPTLHKPIFNRQDL
jgi:hypothetical protein